jgi:predicted metal-dependent phosphoesterase TrpH
MASRVRKRASATNGQARLDLHMHTLRSDGCQTPERVLANCASGRLDVVSITDHDLPPSLPSGEHCLEGHTLRLIHGVELSTFYGDGEQHLLVWFSGEMPDDFRAFCLARARARAERYAEALHSMGLPDLTPPDADAYAGRRALTRRHLALDLVRAGHARSYGEAMRRWALPACGHVPNIRLPMVETLQRARDSGGLTSWAHPDPARCKAWLPKLAKAGLQGIEGIRPGQGRSVRQGFRKLAARHNVLLTGGSDHHGQPGRYLGHFAVSGQASIPLMKALAPPAGCGG